jgi:hypothetical protein
MTLEKTRDKRSQEEFKLKGGELYEEEQSIIDALERYLSYRAPPRPHPLMHWVMW